MNSTPPSFPFRKTPQIWWWEELAGSVKGLQREPYWGLLDGSSLWAAKTLGLDCFQVERPLCSEKDKRDQDRVLRKRS